MAEPPRASRPPTPVFALAPGLLSLAPRSRPHHPGTQQEPPKFKLSGNEANASVDLRHGKLHADGGQAYDAVQTRNACLGPAVALA